MGVICRGAVAVAIGAALAFGSPDAAAQRHRLREVRDDSVDLVMSVGWDWAKAEANAGDRAYFQQGLRKFAERTFQMTEGRLRICKVYVYQQPRAAREADIVVQVNGRAHAALGALRATHGQITMYRQQNSSARTASQFGITLAHEFGHYGLFLRDEYTEAKEPGEGEQPFLGPRVCDVTLATMMGSTGITDLSMPKDYADRDYAPWTPGQALAGAGELTKQQKYRECDKLVAPAAGAAASEDATWRTAHWRHYQLSAWELITAGQRREPLAAEARDPIAVERFPSISGPGMPERLTAPTYDGQCFQAILMEGSFAVVAIDRSQSMSTPTAIPGQTYLDRARAAAKTYVSSAPPGTTIAVVEFASTVAVVVPPTKIPEQNPDATRGQINAVIDGLGAPDGNTGLDAAMSAARDLLLQQSDVGNEQFMVVVSDGEVVASDWLLNQLHGLSIPVFSVGVGAYDSGDVLARVSRLTRGLYKSQQGWGHSQIVEELRHQEPLGVRMYPKPSSNAPIEEPIDVSELDGSTSFRGYWDSADKVGLELVTPSGTVVTPASLPAGVSYEQSEVGAAYRVAAPSLGAWKVRLVPQSTPTGDFHLDVASETSLRLSVEIRGGAAYPEPWFVRARLLAPEPVVGALVKGVLSASAGASTSEVAFRDDGVAPDETADDGVYSAAIASVTDDGVYSLEVSATNPGGARVDAAAVHDEPGPPEPPLPLSAFKRDSSHEIEAIGFREMPQAADGALQIRNDHTPLWVTINQPGDVVWLRFNGYAHGHYVAMTGDLISNDALPLTTKLSLYDTDGTTLLAENAGADGRGYVELVTPKDEDGVYFLKVEHTGSGVGRFRVSVAPYEWFASGAAESGGEDADAGGCGCRAGSSEGSRASWSLLSGIVLLALRRRRKRTTLVPCAAPLGRWHAHRGLHDRDRSRGERVRDR